MDQEAHRTAKLVAGQRIGILRSALIIVSVAALLLAGFARTGSVIGLWDPVEAPDSARGLSVEMLHSGDAREISQAARGAPTDPNPPVSVRSALLIAFAAAALALLLAAGARAARWLSDLPYLLRTGQATAFREAGRFQAAAWPVLVRPARSRARHTGVGSLRLRVRSIAGGESLDTFVAFVFSVVLGVALGIIVALYAG
jgi:hypothetical protein